jgi:hypothetical protein
VTSDGAAPRAALQPPFRAPACRCRHAIGGALLNERTMAKPPAPLTRQWAEGIGGRTEVRA